jgi:uncharacterized protein YegL
MTTTNGSTPNGTDVQRLLSSAQAAGTISAATSQILTGDLGAVVIAGAAGVALEDIQTSDVTLVTVLIDASSSIHARSLEQAVRDGQNLLVDAFSKAKEKDTVLMALWTFNDEVRVHHAYVPVDDAARLDARSYAGVGGTRLYDTWIEALTANVAYAQRLRDGGTPCKSIVVVITDGEDCGSRARPIDCKKVSQELVASEQFVLAFVGVGDDVDFRSIAKRMGIPEGSIALQKDATPAELRKLFHMVSQSAIRASRSAIAPGGAGFFG